MNEIENYNCQGLCVQQFCNERYTHMTTIKLYELDLVLGMCKKHAEEFDNNILKGVEK